MSFAELSVPFLIASLVVFAAGAWAGRMRGGTVARAAVALVLMFALTAVFDNIMIAARLFSYDDDKLLGLRIGKAPVEDFGYPLCAVLIVVGVWHAVSGRGRPAMRKWAILLLASRPASWINTAYPFALTYLFAHGSVDAVLIVGAVFFLVPYNLLMYGVNDVYDYDSDLRNPRKGGAEGALIPPRLHRFVVVSAAAACAPFLVFLALQMRPSSVFALALLLVAVVGYSVPPLRTKQIPVADSMTSSAHFVGPAVVGLLAGGAHWNSAVILLLLSFFLWGMASHAFGAVQDIIPDRAAGIGSTATVFGARATVRLAIGLWAAAAALPLFAGSSSMAVGLLVLPYIAAVWPYRNTGDESSADARKGWARFMVLNYMVGAALTIYLIALVAHGHIRLGAG